MGDTPIAPLNPEEIRAVHADSFSDARTLPAQAYLSPEVLEWERKHIFDRSWVCVGRSTLLDGPRTQRALEVGTEGIVLTRDADGKLRGFFNSCRHRGHELMSLGACASRRTLTCPYHAWSYNLDGTLKAASRFGNGPGFDPAEFPLIPVAVEEWGGWIWVNTGGSAGALAEWHGNLDDYVGNWELERLEVAASHEYVVEANWKLIVENYLECYHCPTIHPELCRVSPPESAEAWPHTGLWIGGPMELREDAETMSLSGRSGGVRLRGLTDAQARTVSYYVLFPNLLVSPHPDYVMTHRLFPVSPTKTKVECAWLFSPESLARPDFDPSYAADFWDITNKQDFTACESVQRGIASAGYRPGPFDYRESGVYALQAMVATAYLTGEFERPRSVDMTAR